MWRKGQNHINIIMLKSTIHTWNDLDCINLVLLLFFNGFDTTGNVSWGCFETEFISIYL